ncbi:MAG TPA: hypothetical protein VLX89_05935 [Actinomycetota bacterium]|nr:hypothetical protein [Actinomycetota bacterium]
MRTTKVAKVTGLVLAAAIAGYLVGPPLAQAAANLVTIKDPKTAQKVRVTAGNLWTDATGSLVYTSDAGNTVIVSGAGNATKSGTGEISGISFDVPNTNNALATLTVRKGTSPGLGVIIWQGTISGASGHLEAPLNQSVYVKSGFNVVLGVDAGATGEQYEIYGVGFGVAFTSAARSAKLAG